VVGKGTVGQLIDPGKADDIQRRFEEELTARGWLGRAK
jgi:hypothetical protein